MMEPVSKLIEKSIKSLMGMDTTQLEVSMKAIPHMEIFSPERNDEGDAG